MGTSARLSNRIAGLLTVGLITALLPGFYAPAQAATLCVNPGGTGGCFDSIQGAIDASGNGDTINVAAGTYAESVVVDKSVTLNGPNAGVSGLDARSPEAHVTSPSEGFSTTVDDVTIDGFQVDGGNMAVAVGGPPGGPNNSGVTITNNVVSSPVRALSLIGSGNNIEFSANLLTSASRQLHVTPDATGFTDLVIDGNRFLGAASSGIQFCCSGADPDIDGFAFTNNEVAGGNANLGVYILNGDISENTFTGTVSPQLQASLHDTTVANNTFDGGGTTRCFQVFGVQYGLVASTNVAVEDNEFTDCGTYALQLSEDVDGIDILHNDFVDTAGDALTTRLRFAGDAPGPEPPPAEWTLNSDIHVNFNNISGSTGLGVNNTVIGTLDAENNWWGDPSGPGPVGPGSGDGVSTNVDYDPWLCAPWDSGVEDCAYDDVAPGGSVTTDPGGGPTPSDNTTTTVVTPAGGPVTITESDTHSGPPPAGYSFLGQEVSITANPSPNPNPLVITFKLDASIVAGIDPNDVVVRKDGVNVPDCDPGNEPSAIPDPCVESRTIDGNGDLVLVIFSTTASIWDFLEPAPICTITGTPGPDELHGTPGNDVICGLGGDDKIYGEGGLDELHGQGDNDTLYGQNGGDLMFGGGGNDDFFGGNGGDEMYGGLGNDRMWGGLGNEDMYGGLGDDLLVGRHGDDYLEGSDGNDTLLAGDGNNTVDGGAGDDLVHAGLGNDTITTDGGFDSVFAGHGANVVDTGGGNDYVLTGTGPDFVTSGTGDDKVETGLGDDIVLTDGGNDAVYLGDGANFVDSGAGDDYVLGGPGVDTIFTGDDNDRIDGEGGNNFIDSGNGVDAIFTGPGNNTINSGSGADFVLTGLGADTIFAGGANDVVFAGRGTNSINGEGGDDYLVGGEDNDAFDGGTGIDTCDAGSLGVDTQVNCENLVGTFP